ncbi:amylo-alpha-1,6-glucosidase [Desulfopila inferna]|uniref:amylo-alpha-1,6-glucosidase n=1 Tax=Desulfopila inferna TaxID=468528 RepID=UPI001964A085|nr:amylo-alpha-1,6-glucosidase [Desulfopila inferna]MBM9603625.1 amylo-alpha-1,6-glucosidase [Desulfopila inferna]
MEDVIQIDDKWYILATSSRADDRTRVLKAEETFGLFDPFGDIRQIGLGDLGLYHSGTRYLSFFEFTVNQRQPLLLNSSVANDNLLLAVDQTTPDLYENNRLVIKKGTIHVFRSKLLTDGVCHEHIRIANYGRQDVALTLEFGFSADYVDIFEVRGVIREKRGLQHKPECTESSVSFHYTGLDEIQRSTIINFSPAPGVIKPHSASYSFILPVQQEKEFYIDIACQYDNSPTRRINYLDALNMNKRESNRVLETTTEIHTSNEQLNDWLNRSMTDLQMLTTKTAFGRYPYAGVPWFSTPFGRDGIITALQSLWVDPGLARGVLGFLSDRQSQTTSVANDAEPGKILHESRTGEMAALGEIPYKNYYGSADSTPLFVILAEAYFRRTGDFKFIEQIWPNILQALEWIDRYGDIDGDGFVEYSRKSSDGILQQGWKDSNDSVFHADGTLAEGPIALCEIQGYVYRAKTAGAKLAAMAGKNDLATELFRQADALHHNFNEIFWCEELETYALALDGRKNLCRVRSSNVGHVLYSGIATKENALRAARTLMNKDSFSGWGIRTIPSNENRYNPMSYHNGTIWPHDNSIAAMGFARYFFKNETLRIFTALFNASVFFDFHRLPELFCGFRKLPGQGPTAYPVACSPQAWSSASVFFLLQACLGLTFTSEKPQVQFHHPQLPDYVDFVRITNMRVGNGFLDLSLRRHTHDVGINVIRKEGDIDIAVIV